MTNGIGQTVFSGWWCRTAAAAALLAVSGCGSNTVADTTPRSITEGPIDTGTFPNLNIPPQVAAPQFTPAEKQAKLAQLKAEQRAQTKGGAEPKGGLSEAELVKLGKTHGKDTLKAIGAKCDPALDPKCK
jgi:hypothetical protein